MHQFAICTIILLFGGAFASKPTISGRIDVDPYIFEGVINSTIEGLRPELPDPLLIDDLNITFPAELADLLSGSADVSNFELTGIQSFQVPALNLAVIGMRLNFTFVLPSINVNTDYIADLLIANLIPLYGHGKANIHLTGVEIQGSAQADLNNGIAVKGLRIQLYLGSANFAIQGALDDEDFSTILNSILNDVVASFIDNHQEFLSNLISPIIEGLLNGILSGASTDTTPAAAAATTGA